jgi:hypothetical protein
MEQVSTILKDTLSLVNLLTMAPQAAIHHHHLLLQEHFHGEGQVSGVLAAVLEAQDRMAAEEVDEDATTIDVIAIQRTSDPALEQHLQAVQKVRQEKDQAETKDARNDASVMGAEEALADEEDIEEDGDTMDAEDHLLHSVVQEEWVGLT